MYIFNYLLLFIDIAFLVSSLIKFNAYYFLITIILFIYLILNIYSTKKIIKESAKTEIAYFELIKKISKDFKNQEFENLYYTLRHLRKTNWYKKIDREYSLDVSKNMNQFYDIDEYKIDKFEK